MIEKMNVVGARALAVAVAGALLGASVPASEAHAANDSYYRPASDSAGMLLCTFNQRDTVQVTPYSAAYIPKGKGALLGCKAGKGFLGLESEATTCRIRGIPGISPDEFQELAALKMTAQAMTTMGISSVITNTISLSQDEAKQLCSPLFGVAQLTTSLDKVKGGGFIEVDAKGNFSEFEPQVSDENIAASLGKALAAGDAMQRGDVLVSDDQRFSLKLQGDGNLVLRMGPAALWATATNGSGADRLKMQNDGNLVLRAGSKAVWASNSNGSGADRAIVQSDGNFVVYKGKKAVWATGTNR